MKRGVFAFLHILNRAMDGWIATQYTFVFRKKRWIHKNGYTIFNVTYQHGCSHLYFFVMSVYIGSESVILVYLLKFYLHLYFKLDARERTASLAVYLRKHLYEGFLTQVNIVLDLANFKKKSIIMNVAISFKIVNAVYNLVASMAALKRIRIVLICTSASRFAGLVGGFNVKCLGIGISKIQVYNDIKSNMCVVEGTSIFCIACDMTGD